MIDQTTEAPAPEPVRVSARAYDALAKSMRRWSGWDKARFTIGKPDASISPYAVTDVREKSFVVNVDALLLNPNRVLLSVNPFRLRQEAVLTGAMLHEAGHARHSKWLPASPDEPPALLSDGSVPSQAVVNLAVLCEEARVEGLIARDEASIGANGLGWTMRATAAALLEPTDLSDVDLDTALMSLIDSWVKRAGRQIALAHHTGHNPPLWVSEFTSLLTGWVGDHLMRTMPEPDPDDDPFGGTDRATMVTMATQVVLNTLRNMIRSEADTGPEMLDMAHTVMTTLFPETPPEEMPSVGGGCGSMGQPEDSDSGSDGDDEAESGDESAEDGDGGAEGQSEGDEPGDGTGEGQGEASEDGEGDGEGGSDGSGMADDAPGLTNKQANALADMAAALEDLESKSESEEKSECKTKSVEAPPADADPTIRGAGSGDGTAYEVGWRRPHAEEWETSRNASRFLRDLINPTESSIVSLTDSPASLVDGAALAAWKAGGQTRDPRFFVRTRREVTPAPPVKVAVLVDVSQSMGVLQKPAALLSWALANAVSDLRNFAGRGQNVESCLIHWGNVARVIQKNGAPLPGLREVSCSEGTWAMHHAMALIEGEMPGFFDPSEKPENRLIVQFTDWDLANRNDATPIMRRAMEAGVNMLTIGPPGYHFRSDLPFLMSGCPIQRGRNVEVVYNKAFPEAVWDEAARVLSH